MLQTEKPASQNFRTLKLLGLRRIKAQWHSGVSDIANVLHSTERRRDKRYQVDLSGTLHVGELALAVTVSDLSASGALVSMPPGSAEPTASDVILVVKTFGPIEARIVHVGDGFFGLRFLQPHQLRDRLSRWLQQDIG